MSRIWQAWVSLWPPGHEADAALHLFIMSCAVAPFIIGVLFLIYGLTEL